MMLLTFEAKLNNDIQAIRIRSPSPLEIVVTRWGEPSDGWVSWDIDMMIAPDDMDADALELYRQLGVLLSRDPYCIMREGIAPDRIGYTITSEASV
jgi:hypothetical protein